MQPGNWVKLDLGVINEKEIRCYLQNYKNDPKQIQELIWRKHWYNSPLKTYVITWVYVTDDSPL